MEGLILRSETPSHKDFEFRATTIKPNAHLISREHLKKRISQCHGRSQDKSSKSYYSYEYLKHPLILLPDYNKS